MAKKSVIAGEFTIEIAENGHVDVVRIPNNAKGTMRNIAAEKGFVVDEKWNTQELGRRLVKEFGDGTTAKFGPITITRMPDNKIEIVEDAPSAIGALRSIAEKVGFTYDSGWNTQLFGLKLADYLIEHKEEADTPLVHKDEQKEENSNGQTTECKKYTLEFECRTIRVDMLELQNTNDETIRLGFEDETEWTEIVASTGNLFMRVEDLECPEDFDDEEAADTLNNMIEDREVYVNGYYPHLNDTITIKVLDEEGNEVTTIDGDDVEKISFEQGYGVDFDDEDDMGKKNFVEKYPSYTTRNLLNWNMNKPNTWYWVNVQLCDMETFMTYEIEVKGDFDPGKLRFITVLAEEWSHGLKSFEVIKDVTYDGVLAKVNDEDACVDDERGFNLFVKLDDKGQWPTKAYDFEYHKESCDND